jgi:hypothetical protein|tara:strand:- start:395 stop:532 length:138 start_codon:yes stop_codon:yes gene_type:complete
VHYRDFPNEWSQDETLAQYQKRDGKDYVLVLERIAETLEKFPITI